MQKNFEEKGDNLVAIDFERKPVFRFGNGARKTCMATAKVGVNAGVRPGSLEVHVHDAPGQPILVSRKSLRALGAVIDFATNKCVFKHVDARKVLTLPEAENGHLLMPVTGDIMAGATSRRTFFSSLAEE